MFLKVVFDIEIYVYYNVVYFYENLELQNVLKFKIIQKKVVFVRILKYYENFKIMIFGKRKKKVLVNKMYKLNCYLMKSCGLLWKVMFFYKNILLIL